MHSHGDTEAQYYFSEIFKKPQKQILYLSCIERSLTILKREIGSTELKEVSKHQVAVDEPTFQKSYIG